MITEEQFLKDVSEHRITVLVDNGLHRCMKFASTGKHSWNQWFYLTTWPGFLCFSGDMGSFVFSRLPDMFEFFRTPADKPTLCINTSYWAEKCQAEDKSDGIEEYSEDLFKQTVKQRFEDYLSWEEYDKETKDECWAALKEEVLTAEGDHEAHARLRDFTFELEGGGTIKFSDTWEWDFKDYTTRFVWCCYAIAWGIREYDKAIVGQDAVNRTA